MIEECSKDALLHVLGNLRDMDRKEVRATWPNISDEGLAGFLLASSRFSFSVMCEGVPVAAGGVCAVSQGVGSLWFLSTDSIRHVIFALTRTFKREILEVLSHMGFHRAEVRTIKGHRQAHRWIEILGGVKESRLKNFGANKETFYLYRFLT